MAIIVASRGEKATLKHLCKNNKSTTFVQTIIADVTNRAYVECRWRDKAPACSYFIPPPEFKSGSRRRSRKSRSGAVPAHALPQSSQTPSMKRRRAPPVSKEVVELDLSCSDAESDGGLVKGVVPPSKRSRHRHDHRPSGRSHRRSDEHDDGGTAG
jgi:hypothetical protein